MHHNPVGPFDQRVRIQKSRAIVLLDRVDVLPPSRPRVS